MAFHLFFLVFGCSSPGWQKARQCKKLIKYARCRLKLLRARRESMICYSREVIASLLKLDELSQALCRVEQLFKDQNRLTAYQEIDKFCQCISERFNCIVEHSCSRDLPNDFNVALSSIVFAATRCGELPELNKLRYLFRDRYGKGFESDNVNLLFGNLVSPKLKQALTTKTFSEDSKVAVIDEIAKEYAVVIGSPYKADVAPEERDLEYGQDEKFLDFTVQATTKNGVDNRSEDSAALDPFTLVHSPLGTRLTKKWSINMKYYHEQLSARTSSESTDEEIRVNEIVYLDDIKDKTPTQLSSHAPFGSAARGKNAVSCGRASCDSHLGFVHPRLPDYDEIVTKFKEIKTVHVQGRRSLWY